MSKRKTIKVMREAKARDEYQTSYFVLYGWTPLIGTDGKLWWGKFK